MSTTPRRFPEQIYITNSTNSTSLITGSLINSGGSAINGNLSISGTTQYFNGTFYAGITAPSSPPGSSYSLKLPNALPSVSGSYLQCDTSGNLTYLTGLMNTYTNTGSVAVTATDVTGLIYSSLQFDIIVTVNITGTIPLKQLYRLSGINATTGWTLSSIAVSGDTSGVVFSIVSGTGQIQYLGTESYGTVTSIVISWTNYQTYPNSTTISSLANNLTVTGSGNLNASSSTLFINPSSTSLTGSNNYYFTYLSTPTITGTTTGSAYTLFINDQPAGASNSYSLYVNSGASYFGGTLTANAGLIIPTRVGGTGNMYNSSSAFTLTATGTSSSVSSGLLTVGGTVTGTFIIGMNLSDTGGIIGNSIYITGFDTGTGGAGTYTILNVGSIDSGPFSITGTYVNSYPVKLDTKVLNKRTRVNRTSINTALSTFKFSTIADNMIRSYIIYSPFLNLFLLTDGNTSRNTPYTSINGIDWVKQTTNVFSTSISSTASCWCSDLRIFIVVARNSSNQPFQVNDSPTTKVWTNYPIIPLSASYQVLSITWSSELMLFVAGTTTTTILTSSNGLTWTENTVGFTPHLTFIHNSNPIIWSAELGIFVITSTTNVLYYSSNGVSWTASNNLGFSCTTLTWSPELYLFVGVLESSSVIITSYDGITWTIPYTYGVINASASHIIWCQEISVFIILGQDYIAISSDGFTWDFQVQQSNKVSSISWSPELSMILLSPSDTKSGSNKVYYSLPVIPASRSTLLVNPSFLQVSSTGKLISNVTTATTSNTTGAITSEGGIGISNTTDASSTTNGGSFTTAGGMAISKQLFAGSIAGTTTSFSGASNYSINLASLSIYPIIEIMIRQTTTVAGDVTIRWDSGLPTDFTQYNAIFTKFNDTTTPFANSATNVLFLNPGITTGVNDMYALIRIIAPSTPSTGQYILQVTGSFYNNTATVGQTRVDATGYVVTSPLNNLHITGGTSGLTGSYRVLSLS